MSRSSTVKSLTARLAEELAVEEAQVAAAVRLLDEGATVPFIARYRKEATGSLDDGQLRTLEERLRYLRELDARRTAVLASIEEQGKLTDELRAALMAADTKSRVEDIYLPYKPKRRTKAQIAREAGLEPLADRLLADPTLIPEEAATEFLCDDVADAPAALEGARHILAERAAEDAELVGAIREKFWKGGSLRTAPWSDDAAKSSAAQKFRDYFEFAESLESMPSHRVLAVMRGEKEEVLALTFDGGDDEVYQAMLAQTLGIDMTSTAAATPWLAATVEWAWRTKLMISARVDARIRLRQRAEEDAVAVFAKNLKDLLLAAPAGNRTTLGLDPGYRTGVKVAVVDGTGKVVDTCAVFPHQPQKQWDSAKATLAALVARHRVELIAVGNGTASRETDALAAELIADIRTAGAEVPAKALVSEAGASVYSASAYAAHELPSLDVTLRGAVSIARRLQDPLAELVKIDPKSIGVGQYQHDVTPGTLARSLDAVVEDAVNAVGVDLNTASVPLLARVSGVSESLAEAIVTHRDKTGPFRPRGRRRSSRATCTPLNGSVSRWTRSATTTSTARSSRCCSVAPGKRTSAGSLSNRTTGSKPGIASQDLTAAMRTAAWRAKAADFAETTASQCRSSSPLTSSTRCWRRPMMPMMPAALVTGQPASVMIGRLKRRCCGHCRPMRLTPR